MLFYFLVEFVYEIDVDNIEYKAETTSQDNVDIKTFHKSTKNGRC